MRRNWIALLALAALLAGCATAQGPVAQKQPWNGGIWNSVLGYVGPANVMVTN